MFSKRTSLIETLSPPTHQQKMSPLSTDTQTLGGNMQALLTSSLDTIDTTWQLFMMEYIDPLLGKTRNEQIHELATSSQALDISDEEKELNRNIGLAIVGLGTSALATLVYPPLMLAAGAIVVWLSIPIYKKAYRSIRYKRKVRLEINATLYTLGVLAFGLYVPGLVGELVYYLSEKLILSTYDRSSKQLSNIFGQQPRAVWVLSDGIEVEIPFEELQVGDTVIIDAGQMIPIDGVIAHGDGSIDQHMLTGEAQPSEKTIGDTVYASTIVLSGKLHIKVEKAGEETTAAQIGKILQDTSSYQMSLESKGVELAHKSALPMLLCSGVALPTVGVVGAVALLTSNFGINIKISSPIAMLNFLNIASRQGTLIKDGRSLELLNQVDTVVFDKTGTLTLDQPYVSQIYSLPGYTETQVLTYAAAAEQRQSHPIAQAILTAVEEQAIEMPELEQAQYEIGYGIKVQVEGVVVQVGSDRYMAMEEISIPPEIQQQQEKSHANGHSLVMVAINNELAGAIELQPTLRPEAQQVIVDLRQRDLDLYIISGDQEGPTRRLAQTLGIENYFANTLPENKADLVEQLQQAGKTVCFVGDGINDSIALKKANVSISLRGATTVATDTAQIVLMDQSLNQLSGLFDLAQNFNTNMKAGFRAAILPGAIVLGGVFLLHFGVFSAITVHSIGLMSSLGVAMAPILKNNMKKEPQAQIETTKEEQ